MTQPHHKFASPSEREIDKAGNFHGSESAVAFTKAATDALSHVVFGDDHDWRNAFLDELSTVEKTVHQLFEKVNYDKLPGRGPLDKGVAMMKLVEKNGGDPSDADENVTEALAREINEDLSENEKLQKMFGRKPGEEAAGQEDGLFQELAKHAIDFKKVLEEMAQVSRMKIFGQGKSTRKEYGKGKKSTIRQMDSISDAVLVDPIYMLTNPLHNLHLATNAYQVPRPYTVIRQKQSVLIRIDRSGSMTCAPKPKIVVAVLMHYIEEMIKGNVSLFVGTFLDKVDELHHVTKDNAEKVVTDVVKAIFRGGGDTHVDRIIKHDQAQIASGKLKTSTGIVKLPENDKPELVIINDGQDEVVVEKSYPAPVNMLTLCDESYEYQAKFVDICRNSNGIFYAKKISLWDD